MPLVKVEIIQGKTQEYKKSLMNGIHNALVRAIKIPDDDRNQRLYELSSENFEKRSSKTDSFTLIETTMFKGRSTDAKRQLYQDIINNLSQSPGIDGDDIIIVLHEPPLINWGINGGRPANEVDLGFDIKV